MLNKEKLLGLFNRVYNNKMEQNDKEDILAYCKKVFGDGEFNPDPSLLHQFNNLVVQKADEIAKPKVTEMISLLATFKPARRDQTIKYEIPQKSKAKVRWSANGSGVDLVRVEGKKYEVAVPKMFSTGFYYEPFGLVADPEDNLRKLIDDLANAKVRLYLGEISKLTQAAITSGKIPKNNVVQGANLKLADYNKLASVLARYGGRPVFVADTLLIDYFAMQQPNNMLSDSKKDELLTALNITSIGRTDAVNLVNPFIDDQNEKVELPVNVGYMFSGDVKQKPFVITEFGGMRQMSEQDMEDERIKLKLTQDADITLLFGQAFGMIKEDASVSI
ncbi:hypothetical protein EEL31_10445 [Brevibacillus laterosporus]|nr:hypothetical protein [Brevibacillus laterosporus]TPG68908.1 hypothetical protein EEL31_10445 [Brevibacillus laterosporus]